MKWSALFPILLLPLSCSKSSSENLNVIDICSIKFTSVDSIAEFIKRKEPNIAKSLSTAENQGCVIGIVDTLATDLTPQNIQAIEIITHHVDGSIGEFVMDRCVRLLASGNPQFVDYLIANPDGSLFKTVVHGISLEMDMFGTSLDAEKEKIGANLITDSQRKLFDKIFEDIDSLMKN